MTCLSGKNMQGGLSSLCRLEMGRRPSSRTTLAIVAAAAAALGTGCIDRDSKSSARDDRDAAVVIRSAVSSSEGTWTNLWGSWPQGRYSHAMAYDSDRKVMVMYGGQAAAAGPFYSETWEWDPARVSWTQRVNTGTDAGTRSGHALAYDPGTKRVFMFSGWQPSAGFYIPGQAEWDPVGSAWVPRANVNPQPTPRHDHAMVYNPDRQRIVMFGGYDETTFRRNDIWEWNGATGTWENCTPAVPATMTPAPRYGHTLAYDSVRKKMVMRGGNTGTGTAVGAWVNETWEWTAGTGAACNSGSWAPVTTTGTAPPYSGNAGFDHIAYDASRSKIVLYEYGPVNSVYELDPTVPTWTMLATTRSDPNTYPSSGYETLVYDPVHANTIVFGGTTYPRSLWAYDGAQALFTNQSVPLVGPIQRSGPALAFDSMRARLILFGGYQASDATSQYKQDIYSWSGINQLWNNETTASTKPDPRQLSALAYDSKRDLMYLFGGNSSTTGYFADFWAWTPSTGSWARVTVNGTPPTGRYGHSLFYDSKRDRVVMFGGAGAAIGEIWEFDPNAATWTKRSLATVPGDISTRSSFDVTYDQDRGKIVVLGGQSYNTAAAAYQFNTDIWEWDVVSAQWGQLVPAASSATPLGRVNHTIAYDSGRRVIVMFGGHGSNNIQLNDSWEWDASSLGWTNTTPTVGIAPLPRDSTTLVYDSSNGSTFLFGGTVSADATYGAQEIWTYSPNNAARPNGAPCSTQTASRCASGNCVDGVCCAASSCAATCQACNVPGAATLGVCSYVAAGTADNSCSSGQACDANHACKASLGQACGTFTDCATGHCADGVCCDTECTDGCKACNIAGKAGTCSNVASGREDPVAAPACVSDSMQPRYCDGNGVCTNAPKPIGSACTASGQCAAPSFCIDGVCCNQACNQTCQTCNNGTTPGSCVALAAGLQDHSATTTCDAATQYCNGSSGPTACQTNKKPNGQTCSVATDCGSGYCVDGICCNSTCVGTCQACNVPGKVGSCVNLPVGSPDNSAAVTCALPQYCDAAGTCQSGLKANGLACTAGSQCATGNCVDGFCCNSACGDACYACNNPNSEGTCGPVPPGGTDGTQCASPNYCTNGACSMGKKPNGASCGLGNECGSNYCIDGTCCENACIGSKCLSCKNSTGSCTYAAKGSDPRKDCGSGDCGGTCDGAGNCAFPPQGKVCGTAGCASDGVIHKQGMCDGAGNCGDDTLDNCKGFRCFHDPTDNMDKCATSCDTDPNCQIAYFCDMPNRVCPPSFPNGQVCSRDAQCVSNHCAIAPGATTGLCCDRDCHACGSCNIPGKEGTCVPALAGTDPNHDCIDSASDPSGVCGGKCNGQWACQFPASGTTCGLCKVCDGAAKCNVMPEDDIACGVIDCDGLDTSCSDYHDLQSKRCASVGACKTANSATACTDISNLCMPDSGSGAGGSSGAGGNPGASDAGTDATTDAGTPLKKGGGGCGCDVGVAGSASSVGWLGITLAGALVFARRRRGRRR